jgi:serine/threonine-protein kinase
MDPFAQTEVILGRYALYGVIASGGMAKVHLGRVLGAAGFSRVVAIKRLHAQFGAEPSFVSMFLDEARLASRIRHPNVVPTLDVVATDGELFLVMEYVQGEALWRLLRTAKGYEGGRIPVAYAASILAGALHGLHSAHEAADEQGEPLRIVHRDVSPQNILVGVDGVARVLDFGIAKSLGRLQTTRDGQLKGKMAYMAPEQLRGAEVDRRTDIFAASIVLWEALTGERLFAAESDVVVFGRVLAAEARPPSELAPGISPELDAIVLKGLSRLPEGRYATARDMARALEQSVPLVAPSEVGDWVARLASDDLALRARHVAAIEGKLGRTSMPPPSLPGPLSLPPPAPSTSSGQAPATETTGSPSASRALPRSEDRGIGVGTILAVGVSVVAVAAVLVAMLSRNARHIPAEAPAIPPLPPAVTAPSASAPPVDVEPETSASATAAASAAARRPPPAGPRPPTKGTPLIPSPRP